MRVLSIDEERGEIEVVVEVLEDLYFLHMLLQRGDTLYGWTTRQMKVSRGGGEEKGDRVPVYMGIEVEKISYAKFSEKLRVTGKVVEAPEDFHAKGSYHTIQVGIGDKLRIIKKNGIDSFTRNVLERSTSSIMRVLLVAVGDEEIAVGLLSPVGIEIKSTIPYTPKGEGKESSIEARYKDPIKQILARVVSVAKTEKIDEIVVAVNEKLSAVTQKILDELGVKARIVKVTEGGESGIHEILRRSDLREMFRSIRVTAEITELEKLLEELFTGSEKVATGLAQVSSAAEWGLVEKVIVNDELLFGETRDQLIEMLDKIFTRNGKVIIIPEESEAGKKLKSLGGIIAKLYYAPTT